MKINTLPALEQFVVITFAWWLHQHLAAELAPGYQTDYTDDLMRLQQNLEDVYPELHAMIHNPDAFKSTEALKREAQS